MRRITPVFLTGIMTATLALSASASVPGKQYSAAAPQLQSQLDSQPFSFDDVRHQLLAPTLDVHPFSNEFYLREFAAEPAESPRSHSKLGSLSNAASTLTKRMASLRRAIARMMP